MSCTGCAKDTVVAILMRIAGDDIVFRRCSRCEANIWEDVDGEITLDIAKAYASTPDRERQAHVFDQMSATEHAITRLWQLRFGEAAQ